MTTLRERIEARRAALLSERAKAEAATPGPWSVYQTIHAEPKIVGPSGRYPFDLIADPSNDPDDYGLSNAELIAAARNALPALIDRVRELEARIDAVRALCDWHDAVVADPPITTHKALTTHMIRAALGGGDS